MLDQFCLNKSLLIESSFILQYFESYIFTQFMIIAFQNNTETAFSKFLHYLISILNMLIKSRNVFIWVRVKSMISLFIKYTHIWLRSWIFWMTSKILLFLPLLQWEEVDLREFIYFLFLLGIKYFSEYFFLFYFPHILAETFECFIWSHWESMIIIWCCGAILFSSKWWHFRIN